MRIISGEHKGRRIEPGKSFKARPTTDFAKENLFNVLSNYFDFNELSVLDLFSGTGSISFEFASRGSSPVDSVEVNAKYHAFIRKTTTELGLTHLRAIRADVFQFLKHTINRYDVVFADPPYEMNEIEQLPHLVFTRNLLKPGGWFIMEHGKEHDFSEHARFREIRRYGSVHFSIFENSIEN